MEPIELNEKTKLNWKRLLITIGIVIITASAIGGSVYYVMNQQAQKDKESAEKTAQDLQKQIDDLKKTETTGTTTTPTIIPTEKYTSTRLKLSFNKDSYFIQENADGINVGYKELYVMPAESIAPGVYGPITIRIYDKGITDAQVSPTTESKTIAGQNAVITTSKFAAYPAPGATRDKNQKIVTIQSKNIMITAQDYNAVGTYDWTRVNTMLDAITSSLAFN